MQQSLLQRLSFLQELRDKLRTLIAAQHYNSAVALYAKTIAVLRKYSNVASLANIQAQSEALMRALELTILDRIDDTSLETTDLTKYVLTCHMTRDPHTHRCPMRDPHRLTMTRPRPRPPRQVYEHATADGGRYSSCYGSVPGGASAPRHTCADHVQGGH